MADNALPGQTGAADPEVLEEITLGLPPDMPDPARIDEYCQVNRYLLQNLRHLERDLLGLERIDRLLERVIEGLRRVTGSRAVELWLHDPVGHLDGAVANRAILGSEVHFARHAHEISMLYAEPVSSQWLEPELAAEMGVFRQQSDASDVFIIPIIEMGHIVGSLNLLDPSGSLMHDPADLELMLDFAAFIPGALHAALRAQETAALMLIDPQTHVANRTGLQREIEREIGRARRVGGTVSIVGIALCGLEAMGNLSQEHLQLKVLRQIALKIGTSLRSTDTMGRLSTFSFGVLVADAQPETVADIAWRYEHALGGESFDDGMGGVVEADPHGVYLTIEPRKFPEKSVAELAVMVMDEVVNGASCTDRCAADLRCLEIKATETV